MDGTGSSWPMPPPSRPPGPTDRAVSVASRRGRSRSSRTRRWWARLGRWQRAAVGFLVVAAVIGGIQAYPHILRWQYEQTYLSRTDLRWSDDDKLAAGYQACDWLRAQPASAFDPDQYNNGGVHAAVVRYWNATGNWWVLRSANVAWIQLCRDVAIDKLGAPHRSIFGESGGGD
jgi:hypothetical protein